MASIVSCFSKFCLTLFLLVLFHGSTNAKLSTNFYSKSCPNLLPTVKFIVHSAIMKEARMGASLLRLFFHDCFVNGCDGSILLDDDTSSFIGEKNAAPNRNSARGFNVVDDIKSAIEIVCPGVVSCADILAISARDSVTILGGPYWDVKLGRRDARTASQAAANNNIPSPSSNLNQLISRFSAHGLSPRDLVALSGSNLAQDFIYRFYRNLLLVHRVGAPARVYNESNIDPSFARTRQRNLYRPNYARPNT
ncbi:hypothetical protein CXB51_036238 [Gossypium anomalum]|uniref:peroxidase n=1 Tax=Gossypium anomalum TaxID=47600 RepID=A0A8J6CDW2_9ROSI|nr:hypothetical protein CXB51_036238 [Gossypium anomalum]